MEVIAEFGPPGDSRYLYGSGCRVAGRVVLTAAHTVAGAHKVWVRGANKVELPAELDPLFVGDPDAPGAGRAPDLAIITISGGPEVSALPLASVDRTSSRGEVLKQCQAVGYPEFAERFSAGSVRDTVHTYGHIPVLSGLVDGLLTLEVGSAPRELPPADKPLAATPWKGMSGAPVLAEGYLVGVVTEHAPRAGSSAITVTPLTALDYNPARSNWGSGVLNAPQWWARLGAPGQNSTALQRLPRTKRAIVAAPGRPLEDATDPFQFEVHRAISLDDSTLADILPTYIPRVHDENLAQVVVAAAAGESSAAFLVGGSSTGKTRACWEALAPLREHGGWKLWHPFDPTRSEAALRSLSQVQAHTVVWLNEAQLYLSGPGDTGERVASGLRTLLGDPTRAPVLILGTLWHEHYSEITQSPLPNWPDLHSQARIILDNRCINVASNFSKEDMEALRVAAIDDPRLSQAAAITHDGRIAQCLAGVPELLARFNNATPPSKALITAAMDARRFTSDLDLSQDLLIAAALGYLADVDLDSLPGNWALTALTQLSAPSKGLRGPLAPARTKASDGSMLVLADYLEQYGAETRGPADVPGTLWQALLDHGSPSEYLTSAEAASRRGLLHLAYQFASAAADAGTVAGLAIAADLLHGAGHVDDAITWYRRAATSGDVKAMLALITLLKDTDESRYWTRCAADAGDRHAASGLARWLRTVGDLEGAITYYKRAATGGDTYAARDLSELLSSMDREEESEYWADYADESEYYDARDEIRDMKDDDRLGLEWLNDVAESFANVEAFDDAISFYEKIIAEAHGDESIPYAGAFAASALVATSSLLRRTKGLESALAWLWTNAKQGRSLALGAAAHLLREAGRIQESDRLARYGWNPDGTISSAWQPASDC